MRIQPENRLNKCNKVWPVHGCVKMHLLEEMNKNYCMASKATDNDKGANNDASLEAVYKMLIMGNNY